MDGEGVSDIFVKEVSEVTIAKREVVFDFVVTVLFTPKVAFFLRRCLNA